LITPDFIIDVAARKIGLEQEGFPIGIKTWGPGRVDAGKTGEPKRETTWTATVQTTEISIKEPALIEKNDYFTRRFNPLPPTEWAIGRQDIFIKSSRRKMLLVKL
jgi:hypothetical protein